MVKGLLNVWIMLCMEIIYEPSMSSVRNWYRFMLERLYSKFHPSRNLGGLSLICVYVIMYVKITKRKMVVHNAVSCKLFRLVHKSPKNICTVLSTSKHSMLHKSHTVGLFQTSSACRLFLHFQVS